MSVEETEVVGLVPEDALFDAAEYYLQLNSFDRSAVLERKVRESQSSQSLSEFCAALAARTPTPGGGSASAAAGAMGAALGEMVMSYSANADTPPCKRSGTRMRAARGRLIELVAEDSQAYADTVTARRASKQDPGPASEQAWTDAIRHAADVPLETARLVAACGRELRALADEVRPYMKSDWTVALGLLNAARQGAVANVVINCDDLRGRGVDISDLDSAVTELSQEL